MTAALRCIIFDLDGTLVDSATVLVEILNEMLVERGSARLVTVEQARPFLSLGGLALVSGLLGEECGDSDSEVAEFRKRYSARRTPIESLYDGVHEGLSELVDAGFDLAICSNKPQDLCEKVLRDLDIFSLFKVIVGSSAGRRAKPAPDLMQLTLERLNASAAMCLFVGDSEVDNALAEATGIGFLFLTYGYCDAGWDSSCVERFNRFSDLVQSIKARRTSSPGLRAVA